MKLQQEIMELLKKRANMPYEYINPNFLQHLIELLSAYYGIEDDEVDEWADSMWSA
jgi:hypothetical protein